MACLSPGERRSNPVARSPGLSSPLAPKPSVALLSGMPRKRPAQRPATPHPDEPRVLHVIKPGPVADDVWGLFAGAWEGWEPSPVPEERQDKPGQRKRSSKP
jgi:hypothetical protein